MQEGGLIEEGLKSSVIVEPLNVEYRMSNVEVKNSIPLRLPVWPPPEPWLGSRLRNG